VIQRSGYSPLAAIVVIFALFALVATGMSDFTLHLFVVAGYLAVLAVSTNVAFGLAGLLTLAPPFFYGGAAYILALLTTRHGWSPWTALAAAVAVAALAGVVVGLICLRLRGVFFALATFAVAMIGATFAINFDEITGGTVGIRDIPPLTFGETKVTTEYGSLLVVIVALAIVTWIFVRISSAPIGRALRALRDRDDLAESVGIPVMRFQLLAFVIASVLAALAGGLFATYERFVSPELLGVSVAIQILVVLVIGGPGYVVGPIIAAVGVTYLPEVLSEAQDWSTFVYSVILLLAVLLLPTGVEGAAREGLSNWRSRRRDGRGPTLRKKGSEEAGT
jgi:branched-chain amino acid transport system permease protein